MTKLNFASYLQEENHHLIKLVKNIISQEEREKYKNWLIEKGELKRAAFIEQLSIAFQTMKISDMPDLKDVSAEWSRVIGASSLKELLREEPLYPAEELSKEELIFNRDEMFQLATPTINIAWEKTDIHNIGETRLWGEPDLPQDADWPTLNDCISPLDWEKDEKNLDSKCAFIGQINFADFKESLLYDSLPSKGLLSIFSYIDDDVFNLCMRYYKDTSTLEHRKAPKSLNEDNKTQQPHSAVFSEALAFPSYSGPWESSLQLEKEDQGLDEGAYECLKEGGEADLIGILGYLQDTTGIDPTPSKDFRKFLCLKVTPECGTVHTAIKPEHAKQGVLEDYVYAWIDYDI